MCDHLGTPIGLVDGNGEKAGQVTWAASYGAWGEVREEYNPYRIEQNIRFQGQQLDAETGLHYNRFRYYDPNIGQYITQDPIGLNGGINKSSYPVNPMNWVDPMGLAEEGGGLLSKIYGWWDKGSKAKDGIDAGKLSLENRKLEKELARLRDELLMCLAKSPTCQTAEMEKIENRIDEVSKKILNNTGEITKIMMETPGASAGGPVHIPGL
nr:RHS repeat-associated core domain-containing protein [Acidovorax sp. SUPP2522]